MKSKELKTYNLPADDVLISSINAKPNFLLGLLLVIGLICLINSYSFYYGIAIIIVSFSALVFMPKVTLMDFFQDYLVMYNKADKNNCVMIYYEDIVSWNYNWSTNKDYLNIELVDGTIEHIEAFSKTLFESNMNRFLKDKRKSK